MYNDRFAVFIYQNKIIETTSLSFIRKIRNNSEGDVPKLFVIQLFHIHIIREVLKVTLSVYYYFFRCIFHTLFDKFFVTINKSLCTILSFLRIEFQFFLWYNYKYPFIIMKYLHDRDDITEAFIKKNHPLIMYHLI